MVSLLRELEKYPSKIKEVLFLSYLISCITISVTKVCRGKLQSGYGKISKPLNFRDYTEKEEIGNMAAFLTTAINHHTKNKL